jgi:hypothetical protein
MITHHQGKRKDTRNTSSIPAYSRVEFSFKIHAVNSRNKGQRHEDGGNDGEDLHTSLNRLLMLDR